MNEDGTQHSQMLLICFSHLRVAGNIAEMIMTEARNVMSAPLSPSGMLSNEL
jgi:hypothetical protein